MSYGQGQPQWDPWTPGSQQPQWADQSSRTPDWAALAEASESRNRRRRLLMIVGGAFATFAIGTAVAVAVVNANSGTETPNRPTNGLPATADIPSTSAEPDPTFAPTSAPPPLDPKEFISSAKKDKADLSPETLFPGNRLTMGDTVYTKGLTASTKKCASAVQGTLDKVLKDNGCNRVMRVTYAKDGIAVTVGVALFNTEAQATKAKQEADKKSIVTSLPGDGIGAFCRTAICRSTTNSYGRYAYFTLAGFTNGKDVTEKDTAVFDTGDDLAEFTFRQIRRRGEAQASAAANE
ncbi:hypothetical protein [Streptomyces sp. NPDC002845]